MIKAALTQERFSFKGQVYQFPAPGFRADRAHTVSDPAYIDPTDRRTDQAVDLSARAAESAADVGDGEFARFDPARRAPGPGHHHVASAGRGFARAAARLSRHGCARPQVRNCRSARDAAIMRDTFVADTEEEAVRIAGGPMMDRSISPTGAARASISTPARNCRPRRKRHLKKRLTYEFVRDRSVYFGPPEQDRAADPAPASRNGHFQRDFQDLLVRSAACGGARKRAPLGNRGDPRGPCRFARGTAQPVPRNRSGCPDQALSCSTSSANRAERVTKAAQRRAATSCSRSLHRAEDAAQQRHRAQLPGLRRRSVCQVPQIGDARIQRVQDAAGDLVAAAGKQHRVEAAKRLNIGSPVLCTRCRFGAIHSLTQGGHLLVTVARSMNGARHGRLQRGADLVDLARLFTRHGGDREHAALAAHDQALGFQRLQSGAHAGAADPEFARPSRARPGAFPAQAEAQNGLPQCLRAAVAALVSCLALMARYSIAAATAEPSESSGS